MPYKDPEAQKKAQYEYYLRNKDKTDAQHKIYKEEARAKINLLKQEPCTDCGQKFHYSAMDFDHVRGAKLGDVSKFISNRQYAKAFAEIVKCELVCANCHRVRSWNRIQ